MIVALLLALVLIGAAFALLVRAATLPKVRTGESISQIGAYGFAGEAAPDGPAGASLLPELAARLGRRLVRRGGEERQAELRNLLLAAGWYRVAPATFLGYRLLGAVAATATLVWFGSARGLSVPWILFLALYGPVLGSLLPLFVLKSRARRRLERIELELPELIDLLVVTLEAGLGLGAALNRSCERMRGPLGEEMRLVLHEQSLGLTMQSALRNMLTRCDVPAVRSFVRAISQSEALGVSIAQLIRELAGDLRQRRQQIVEEKAQKAPIKILFPLAFLILPALFIVLLYPGLYNLYTALGS